jgi:hypothetical protein
VVLPRLEQAIGLLHGAEFVLFTVDLKRQVVVLGHFGLPVINEAGDDWHGCVELAFEVLLDLVEVKIFNEVPRLLTVVAVL